LSDGFVSLLVGFGRLLRERGLPVGTNRILTFCRAAATLAPLERDTLYWTGRATLVAHPDHTAVYDEAFVRYFGRSRMEQTLRSTLRGLNPPNSAEMKTEVVMTFQDEPGSGQDANGTETEGIRLTASALEVLKAKSFEDLSEEERIHADRLIRNLVPFLPLKHSRRLRVAARGERFDLRRTVRSSLRTQGEPLERAWLTRRDRHRPLVLLLDVSGSMGPYARALMQFGYTAAASGGRVEVFCFGTRLTRITRALRSNDPDRALAEAAGRVHDWEGGTRIGDCLKRLLDDYSQAAALKGAVVLICSDGLERGDPALLAAQMERLHRVAHRLIWVNPLKGGTAYEPLQRGMMAALPHVDRFMPGHNVASLESLCETLVQ
jgi:uncharacterized protein with von Willebrand factor type A (vWA) domain